MLALTAFVPDHWIALTINFLGTFIAAFGMPAIANLTLEQAPESRGTMMSINNVLSFVGACIGVARALFSLKITFMEKSSIRARVHMR